MRSRSAAGTPGPWSLTVISAHRVGRAFRARPRGLRRRRACSALSSRFCSIRRSMRASPSAVRAVGAHRRAGALGLARHQCGEIERLEVRARSGCSSARREQHVVDQRVELGDVRARTRRAAARAPLRRQRLGRVEQQLERHAQPRQRRAQLVRGAAPARACCWLDQRVDPGSGLVEARAPAARSRRVRARARAP